MKFCKKATAIIFAAAVFASCSAKKNDSPAESTSSDVTEKVSSDTETETVVNSGWSYGQVAIGGGGFVTGIISTNEPDLYYARTDVGGAYRWDKDSGRWISLSYDITKDDVGLLGIDGIAVDPHNAANVYMIAGTSYFSGGKTSVFISHDYGSHFTQHEVTDLIRVHGNGMGRGNGERIAVDPNDPNVILIGGRFGGMIRSEDGGETWASCASPITGSTKNENGINIIAFDENKPGRVYAGVSARGEDNLFYSDDSGENWSPITIEKETVQKYMPQRFDINSQGKLYVCFGNNEGPWNSMTGALYRFDIDKGTADSISPKKCTIGDIVIDPKDDNRIVLVTSEVWEQQPNGAYGDVFLRSTDGGDTWEEITPDKYTLSSGECPWISNAAIHWCSSLAMDSADSDKILVNSGNGIFACNNIWDERPDIYFDSLGLEETVPEDLISYEGYDLISAVGDYDGFIHTDIFTPAQRHTKQIGSVSSLSIAAQDHDKWVKVGGDESNMALTYSEDGGKTWSDITNSPEDGKVFYRGNVALSADGRSLVWSPQNGLHAYQSDDFGKTWNEVGGIAGNSGAYIIGDMVDPDIMYACGNSVFYVSRDKGKSFKRIYDTSGKFKRMAVSPTEKGRVYIPAGGMGLMTTADAGENMSLVQGLKYCEAVGLGKPAKDGDPYVIYVWGTPKDSDTEGIYMSEDNGGSWVRVNDDLHNFGGIGNGEFIVGDMNEYGRCYMSTVGLGIIYCDKVKN